MICGLGYNIKVNVEKYSIALNKKMINQQLLDYIKQQSQQNVSKEQVKSSLVANGWASFDVDEAFSVVLSQPSVIPQPSIDTVQKIQLVPDTINPEVVQQDSIDKDTQKSFNKVILELLSIIIVLGALSILGWFAFKYFFSPKINNQTEVPLVSQEKNKTSHSQTSPKISVTPITSNPDIINPDIEKVNAALFDIRQGYLTGNEALIVKHESTETAKFFASASGKIKPVSAFVVDNVLPLGANILANISSTETTLTGPMVFIKENGDWKFDITATFKYIGDQNNANKGAGDSNGLPDLIVMSATVYPSRPIVNSKDVKVTLNIKNVGTKTSDNGAPLVATLVGFADGTPVQGGPLLAIAPGQIATYDFYPYHGNDFFKVSDKSGQKTIQIVLNKDRKILESNYDNNLFTQTVYMYSN